MDPYLESPVFWGGFHTRLITAISETLNARLPDRYFAEIDEYVWLEDQPPGERERLGEPDAFLTEKNGAPGEVTEHGPAPVAVAIIAPAVRVTLPKAKKHRHRFVKIVGPDHNTVVTVIELLSPSNKDRGEDQEKYLDKRDEYLASRTNLVEIDLLRDGARMPFGKPSPRIADYYLFVCRGKSYPEAEVWPFTIREPIPAIPVPLKPEHDDVRLDLQSCVTEIYDTNRYAARTDYSQQPSPPLRRGDAEWASELLKKYAATRK